MPDVDTVEEVEAHSKSRFVIAVATAISSGILGTSGGWFSADRNTDARFEEASTSRNELARSLLNVVESRITNERIATNTKLSKLEEAFVAKEELLRARIRELEYQIRHHADIPDAHSTLRRDDDTEGEGSPDHGGAGSDGLAHRRHAGQGH